jgi:hypothetical protein
VRKHYVIIHSAVIRTGEERLREERFMPHPLHPSRPFADRSGDFVYEVHKHFNFDFRPSNTERRRIVEKAAEGLLIEGKKLGKQREAEWMARELINVKGGTKSQVYAIVAHLYTMESFLYKNLNAIMRLVSDADDDQHTDLWKNKVPTYGPFAFLLNTQDDGCEEYMTVYRGANLSEDLVKQYKEKWLSTFSNPVYTSDEWKNGVRFPAFTSTSQNRAKAEQFGNVLFIIKLSARSQRGYDVSVYSEYPSEEEVLLHANFAYRIQSCEFDETTDKWIIKLNDFYL